MGKPKWWGRACDELRAGDPVLVIPPKETD